jgi:6-phosphogluconolactonase (cycloisomerase 2 family)
MNISPVKAFCLATALVFTLSCSKSSDSQPGASNGPGPATILYAAQSGGDSIQVFSVDPAKLSAPVLLQSIPSGGTSPSALVLHPSKKSITAMNLNSGTAVTFGIDAKSGLLTKVSTVTAGSAGAYTPDGKFFYAVYIAGISGATAVMGASVDPTTGVLTPLAGSPFNIGAVTNIISVAVTQNGLLFAADDGNGKIYAAKIAADGSLSASGTPAPLTGATTVAMSPDNETLIGLSYDNGTATSFRIADTNGNLSPVTVFSQQTPTAATFNPAGTRVYVASAQPEVLALFDVNPGTSAIQPNGGAFTGGWGKAIAIDPAEKVLAVAASSQPGVPAAQDGIYLYNVDGAFFGEGGYIPFPPNSQPSAVTLISIP